MAEQSPDSGDAIEQYSQMIKARESGGNYRARGPVTANGDRAYGVHQVMGENIPRWTQELFGQPMTVKQFVDDPEAQEKLFRYKFGQYMEETGSPKDAASKWFTGKPFSQGQYKRDVLGTTGSKYAGGFPSTMPTYKPADSDDDLMNEMSGAPSKKAAPASASSGGISDDDLLKELSGGPTTVTVPRKALPGEVLPPAKADQPESAGAYVARRLAETQGSSYLDTATRFGLGGLRGIGDVADTLAEGITGLGRQGSGVLAKAGAISPQSALTVRNWADRVQGNIASDYAAYDKSSTGSPAAGVGRIGGEIAGSAPFFEMAGATVPAEVATAFQALKQSHPLVARLLQGAGVGGTGSALTSSASDMPLGTQMAIGGVAGAGLGGVLAPLVGAGAKYVGKSAQSLWNAFTDKGQVKLATDLLEKNATTPIASNSTQIIPGSNPTLAEATGDANIARIQRSVRDLNPKPFADLEEANNNARNDYWHNTTGTKADVDTAQQALDTRTKNTLDNLFKPGQKADASPVVAKIDSILNGPSGGRGSVQTVMNDVRSRIVDKNGNLETDPETLYNSVRKHIGDLLDKRADSAAGQQASRELMQVRDELDKAITKSTKGFDQYLKDYSAGKRPIDAMEYMQGLNLFDSKGNMTLAKVQNALNQIKKGISASPTHKANSLDASHVQSLEALRDDLLRQEKSQLGITKDSATAQNIATQSILPKGSIGGQIAEKYAPASVGAATGGYLGSLVMPGVGTAVGSALGGISGNALSKILATKNGAVQSALEFMLTNPSAFQPRGITVPRRAGVLNYGVSGMAPALTRALAPPRQKSP